MWRKLIAVAFMAHATPVYALDDFGWSYRGELGGFDHCVHWFETREPRETTWHDNFLCHSTGYDIRWSSSGPIPAMRCTQILEAADPHTWADNFLCVEPDAPFIFSWSSHNPIRGAECLQILEPSDPATWNDNYLCVNSTGGEIAGLRRVASGEGVAAGISLKTDPLPNRETGPDANIPYRLFLDSFYLHEQQDRREDLYLKVHRIDGNGNWAELQTRTFYNLDEGHRYTAWSPNVVLYTGQPAGRLRMVVELFDAKTNGFERMLSITKWSTKAISTIVGKMGDSWTFGASSIAIAVAGEALAESLKNRGPGDDTSYGVRTITIGPSGFPVSERERTFDVNFAGGGFRDYDIDVRFRLVRMDLSAAPVPTEQCPPTYRCYERSADGSSCLRGFCLPPDIPVDTGDGVIRRQ
jgi:hypothetical protein